MQDAAEAIAAANVKVNAELVSLLERALADAKSGRIVAGGVVAVIGPSQFMAFSAFATFPAETIAGAEVMKANVITRMQQPRQPVLVRAGALPKTN